MQATGRYGSLDALLAFDGSTFFLSSPNGDTESAELAHGLFFADTRHLSEWRLLIDHQPIRPISSGQIDGHWARIEGRVKGGRLSVRRHRLVRGGMHEDIELHNLGEEPLEVHMSLRLGVDFADIFEVRGHVRSRRRDIHVAAGEGRLVFTYERDGFSRGTTVESSAWHRFAPDGATATVRLDPGVRWQTCLNITCWMQGRPHVPEDACVFRAAPDPPPGGHRGSWEGMPLLDTDHAGIRHAYAQSIADLDALEFTPIMEGAPLALPAAGLPWYMALFGRDSLITAYQVLPFRPELTAAVLEALSVTQAATRDDFRDAEPGKILHELRFGESAVLGDLPHSPYYGAHDTTPLFLIVLDEYHRWTGDHRFVRSLEEAARSALGWIREFGDLDGDGYLDYQTRSEKGLRNQCWKDSHDSITFHDGALAEPPIAVCEIQGYAYDARVRAARLARLVWKDEYLAGRLEREASDLKERFNRDFWHPERGHYVLALDGSKRQVDAMTSNVGHLLWSGIVDPRRAGPTVDRLMAPDMFSGWGIRTMSTGNGAYDPLSYHNGTVWPHDTALVAEGLRRYGFRREAATVLEGLFAAAESFEYRLPELFAGHSREKGAPDSYPVASRPQAWAAGAPFLAVRTLLGMDPVGGRILSDPILPAGTRRMRLLGVQSADDRIDLP